MGRPLNLLHKASTPDVMKTRQRVGYIAAVGLFLGPCLGRDYSTSLSVWNETCVDVGLC